MPTSTANYWQSPKTVKVRPPLPCAPSYMTPIYRGSRPDLAQGGITLTQVPEDAEFDGMPRAAIETGMVDLALPGGNAAKAEATAGLF